jgi:hypothetical protein
LGAKDLKNRKIPGISIDNKLISFLREYSKQTGIPQTRLLDKAIELLKEKVEKGENLYE